MPALRVMPAAAATCHRFAFYVAIPSAPFTPENTELTKFFGQNEQNFSESILLIL